VQTKDTNKPGTNTRSSDWPRASRVNIRRDIERIEKERAAVLATYDSVLRTLRGHESFLDACQKGLRQQRRGPAIPLADEVRKRISESQKKRWAALQTTELSRI